MLKLLDRFSICLFLILLSSLYIKTSIADNYSFDDPNLKKSFDQAIIAIAGEDPKRERVMTLRNLGKGMSPAKKILLEIGDKKHLMKIFPKNKPEQTR